MRPTPDIPVRIVAMPETAERSITVTLAETGRDIRLPRGEIDFTPGTVWIPVWLHKKLKPYLTDGGASFGPAQSFHDRQTGS